MSPLNSGKPLDDIHSALVFELRRKNVQVTQDILLDAPEGHRQSDQYLEDWHRYVNDRFGVVKTMQPHDNMTCV